MSNDINDLTTRQMTAPRALWVRGMCGTAREYVRVPPENLVIATNSCPENPAGAMRRAHAPVPVRSRSKHRAAPGMIAIPLFFTVFSTNRN
jgi:hypothetical protein